MNKCARKEGNKVKYFADLYHVSKAKNITQVKRKRHKRRAAIEPVIGHLKYNYRMIRNYTDWTNNIVQYRLRLIVPFV